MCLFVGLTAAVGCETGFTITYVNETDKTIAIYYGDDYDFSEYDFIIQPHSTERAGVLTITFKGVVIGRDEEGNLLFRNEITRDQLKAQGYRFVITEDMLSPTPTGGPWQSPRPRIDFIHDRNFMEWWADR
jgi:hypothetical protein